MVPRKITYKEYQEILKEKENSLFWSCHFFGIFFNKNIFATSLAQI